MQNFVRNAVSLSLVIVGSLVFASGCERRLSATESGALVGTGVGAGMGAVVGSAVGATGPGIAIGGVGGGGVGGLIGQEAQDDEARTAQMQEVVRRQEEELARQEREIQDLRRQRGLNEELSQFKK